MRAVVQRVARASVTVDLKQRINIMRLFFLSTLAILFSTIVATVSGQTAQTADSPQLIESRDLTLRVAKLYGKHKYDEALPLATRALELAEAAVGSKDERLIPALINLGDLQVATIHFDNAKASFERALSLAESNFGPEDLRVARPLDELGYLLANKGDLGKSADLFSRSLIIKEKLLQPSDIEIPRAARILADTYRRAHEYAKAEQFYSRAIQLYEQDGKKDAELVESLNRYRTVLAAENKKDEAAAVQAKIAELSSDGGAVEGGVVNGWAVKLVQPSYPTSAPRRYGILTVSVRVTIDEKGKVISAKAGPPPGPDLSYPAFAGAAEDAARKSLFTPTLKSGVAVKVNGTIIYQFIAR